MHYARHILLAAAPLLACSGPPADPPGEAASTGEAASSSAGQSGSTGVPTSSDSSSSSGEPTSGDSWSTSTSSGDDTSTGDATSTGEVSEQNPDFTLIDVNPNSASFEQPVSPRDYLDHVSGWYFAHAT